MALELCSAGSALAFADWPEVQEQPAAISLEERVGTPGGRSVSDRYFGGSQADIF